METHIFGPAADKIVRSVRQEIDLVNGAEVHLRHPLRTGGQIDEFN